MHHQQGRWQGQNTWSQQTSICLRLKMGKRSPSQGLLQTGYPAMSLTLPGFECAWLKGFLKLYHIENKLLLPDLCPSGASGGGNRRQHFTKKFSANNLFSRKCSLMAAENICQCRSTSLNSFHHYEKLLVPPKYQNEDLCLLNPSFHCPNHLQKLLTKGKR